MKTDFFTALNEILQSGNSLLLSTIISHHGSSPRGTGARMAITSNRHQIGTIGGGQLEEGLHEKYSQFLESQNSIILYFVLSEAEAANLEMICGGSISLLVDPISSENAALVVMYEKIHQTVIEQKIGWLFSYLPDTARQDSPLKCFVSSDQQINGTWTPDFIFIEGVPEEISFDGNLIKLSGLDLKKPQVLKSGKTRIFFEPIGQRSTVMIVGAGHIAQKLAPLTTMVGFQTVVLDDREDFISELRFPAIDKRILLGNFDHVFEEMNIDDQTFIVIVTRGHQFDKSVLCQALRTSASYVGMIGSRRKIKLTFEALVEEGVSEVELSKVHSPIGLNIGSETPEEIAVSIVAELIQERSHLNI